MNARWSIIAASLLLWLSSTAGSGLAEAATLRVNAGGNLQTALDAALPGDVILLEAGATFSGNFELPVKTGTQVITVRSSTADDQLPASGVRITPAYAPRLAKIVSPNSAPALRTAAGAHHWRLMLLEFPATYLGYETIIALGDASSAQAQLSQIPFEIELDRVYVHGHPLYGQKRGVALNGRALTVRNSYISDIKAVGVDSQAIAGWNGPGPFTIENNYLEATGENFLLGGGDPSITGLVPENIIFRRNHVSRPMAWRDPVIPTPAGVTLRAGSAGTLAAGTYAYRVVAFRPIGAGATGRSAASAEIAVSIPQQGGITVAWQPVAGATSYRVYGRRPGASDRYWTVTGTTFVDSGSAGTAGAAPSGPGDHWQVKNLFELKNARRVLIEFNIFENNWAAAQNGYAILFTPRGQGGKCSWCVVEDVTFQYNIVRNTSAVFNILGYDSAAVSAQTNNVRIRHNLFYGVTRQLGGTGWFLLIGDEPRNIVVDHNTIDADGSAIIYAYGGTSTDPRQITGFQFTNNATRHNEYGINGAGVAYGNGALTTYFPNAIVNGNWLQGGTASRYPTGNFFAGLFADAFIDRTAGDYRPVSGGPLSGHATDGTDIGADMGTLLARTAGVLQGLPGVRAPQAPSGVRMVTR